MSHNIKLHGIEIAVTSKCNLLCKHCYQGDDKKKNYELSTDIVAGILKDAKSYGADIAILTGGEFFVHPHFKEIIDFANDLRFAINIASNGTMINGKTIKLLQSINRFLIQISIDGFKKDHDWRRGRGTFDKSIRSIKRLINSGLQVGVTVTIDKRNVIYLDEMIAYLGSIGVKNITFLTIAAAGFALDNVRDLILEEKHRNIIRNIYKKYTHRMTPWKRCNIFTRTISVNYDGVIYPCTMARSLEIFPLGNIYNTSLKDVWNNTLMENKYPFIDFKLKDLKECSTCEFVNECGGQCRIRAYKYFGDFFAPDPFACFVYKGIEGENIQNLMWGTRKIELQ
jgi:radical SAM protein with 4Fe4S-binding SPASM domain